MNTELRVEAKSDSEKANEERFHLKANGECKKTQRYQTCKNHLKKKLFSVRARLSHNKMVYKNLLAIEMNKAKVKMNKSVYLVLSKLDISKTLMYEFWYDDIKRKYREKANFC